MARRGGPWARRRCEQHCAACHSRTCALGRPTTRARPRTRARAPTPRRPLPPWPRHPPPPCGRRRANRPRTPRGRRRRAGRWRRPRPRWRWPPRRRGSPPRTRRAGRRDARGARHKKSRGGLAPACAATRPDRPTAEPRARRPRGRRKWALRQRSRLLGSPHVLHNLPSCRWQGLASQHKYLSNCLRGPEDSLAAITLPRRDAVPSTREGEGRGKKTRPTKASRLARARPVSRRGNPPQCARASPPRPRRNLSACCESSARPTPAPATARNASGSPTRPNRCREARRRGPSALLRRCGGPNNSAS